MFYMKSINVLYEKYKCYIQKVHYIVRAAKNDTSMCLKQ
ncbi:hypothetical protein CLU82_2718 [Flavobacterium sp. 5]|nr:hypothetical protein CLU82_2718 [Flavobacterium sp. 5]